MANKNEKSDVLPMGGNPAWRGGPQARANFVKPKNFKGTLLRMWRLILPEKKGVLIVFCFAALSSVAAIFTPYLIGRCVDAVKNQTPLASLLLLLLAFYVGDALVRFLQGYLNAAVSQRIVLSLRKTLFEKLQRLPISFFDTRTHGELMSRITNDIQNVSSTISDSLTHLMLLLVTIVGVLIMMLSLNRFLTLAAMITTPLIYLLTNFVTKRSRVLFKKQQESLGRLNGLIEESISGLMLVKSFCMEEEIKEKFTENSIELCKVGTKALVISGLLMPIMNVINNLSFVAVTVTGGVLAISGAISTGVISSFLLYSRQFSRPLNEIANIYNTLQTAVAGAERVFEIMDEEEEVKDKPEAKQITKPRGEVVFKHVSFGYNKETTVLKGINFQVKPGSKIAIVGSTGAGKTTIISLLARYYDVTDGQILIDGTDIRDYTRRSLRDNMSVVLQEPCLFNTTIRENIRYGAPEATDEEVIEAAKIANAHEFIDKLPEGYDTILGDEGGLLSQGQRQLLTIARAVLSKGSILILDEATSSVDTLTERAIRKALLALMKERTSFVIAHRLSTIRDSDLIMVVEGGGIIEAGTHDELVSLNGRYAAMNNANTVGYA